VPIVCEPSKDAQQLAYGIGEQASLARSVGELAQMLEAHPGETLVVIGHNIAAEDALDFAAVSRLVRPVMGVILVRGTVDLTLMSRALQAGVREVVLAGDYPSLASACQRSRELTRRLQLTAPPPQEPAPQPERGRIITVFAAKGGCGKTTIAVNLAVSLAKHCDRRVCVVDLDLAFGDVAISVQLDPVRTIVDALPMAGHLDTTGAASLLTGYRPGLAMLLAPVTPGDAERIPPTLVGELLSVLRGMFDFVVVDTPAQFSEHVLTAMDASVHHVLLTTPDVAALKNLRVTLDMLDMLSYPREARSIVLNRSDSKVGLSLDDVERTVRCRLAAQVPSSRAVPMSINQGTPITMSNPGHAVSQAIIRFASDQLLVPSPVPQQRPQKSATHNRRAR
jgi:Flp pilus assembly CpaE family ATPase